MKCSRPEYDMEVVGNNLKRLRKENHLSVEDVRQYLVFESVQAVYKFESGKGYPATDNLLALMELYGVDDIREITTVHGMNAHEYEEADEASSCYIETYAA